MSRRPHLQEITPGNVETACRLAVRPDQERFVSPVAWSLAEAYARPEIAWPRLIVAGDEVVGFLMAFLDIRWHPDRPDDVRSGLWRLNIAAEHQGKGYGRFALEAVCDEVRRRGRDRVVTTWEPGDDGPEQFYLHLGFRPTGETSGGQTVGALSLASTPPCALRFLRRISSGPRLAPPDRPHHPATNRRPRPSATRCVARPRSPSPIPAVSM